LFILRNLVSGFFKSTNSLILALESLFDEHQIKGWRGNWGQNLFAKFPTFFHVTSSNKTSLVKYSIIFVDKF